MTEFPALRDALVRAGLRRRRRRRRLLVGVPAFAACASAVVVLALPGPAPDRERVADPPRGPLEAAFGAFRRERTPADELPAGMVPPGRADRAASRLVARDGDVRIYAVPTVLRGKASLCLMRIDGSARCSAVADAVREGTPIGGMSAKYFEILLRDGTRDIRATLADGKRLAPAMQGGALLVRTTSRLAVLSWTGASGERHVLRTAFAPKTTTPPTSCPAALDPLPRAENAQAERAALLIVDRLYPHAASAAVTGSARPLGTPCPDAVTERSMEVRLSLVPHDRAARRSARLSQGRVLVGNIDGRMTVFYLLH